MAQRRRPDSKGMKQSRRKDSGGMSSLKGLLYSRCCQIFVELILPSQRSSDSLKRLMVYTIAISICVWVFFHTASTTDSAQDLLVSDFILRAGGQPKWDLFESLSYSVAVKLRMSTLRKTCHVQCFLTHLDSKTFPSAKKGDVMKLKNATTSYVKSHDKLVCDFPCSCFHVGCNWCSGSSSVFQWDPFFNAESFAEDSIKGYLENKILVTRKKHFSVLRILFAKKESVYFWQQRTSQHNEEPCSTLSKVQHMSSWKQQFKTSD